jgi:endonuclease/exonuclease/phosphatase family metal-dependent hydrolase
LLAELAAPAPAGPLLFVNHLPSWKPQLELERERQTVAAARRMRTSVSCITTGEPARRIDHVFVRGDERGPTPRITACELAFAEPVGGVWASDHFGVVADLEVPSG